MATVRITKELIANIEFIAWNKMQPTIDKAKAIKPDNTWGQRIYDILFADIKPLIQQLPTGWVDNTDTFSVSSVGSLVCGLRFALATPQPWPCQTIKNEHAVVNKTYKHDVALKDHLVWGELFAEVAEYQKRVVAAEVQCKEFVESVKKVCASYSTLSQALKAWPPLWDLLPDDVKDKHREVKERKKREKVVLNVDLDRLTAMSTAIKLGL